MVVQEEETPKNATTKKIENDVDKNIDLAENKLDFEKVSPIEEKEEDKEKDTNEDSQNEIENFNILADTEIIDEKIENIPIQEIENREETEDKELEDTKFEIRADEKESSKERKDNFVTIENPQGVETGIEIFYTSMKLKNFPILESNISKYEKEIERIGLDNTTVKVGDVELLNTKISFINYKRFRVVEFKTREFMFALSIKLEENEVTREGDFFKYQIYSNLKNSRLAFVVNTLRAIFGGENISFSLGKLLGNISFENSIEINKLGLILDTLERYENICKVLKVKKIRSLSETSMSFYTIHLLDLLLKNQSIDTWVNFRIDNNSNLSVGDIPIFIRDYQLDLRGVNFKLREKITLKEGASKNEIKAQENKVVGFRKLAKIELEKI